MVATLVEITSGGSVGGGIQFVCEGVTRRGRVSVAGKFELEHEAVREVDELEEQTMGVWGRAHGTRP